jgi:hypothetical protein
MSRWSRSLASIGLLALLAVAPARAVIFDATGDPNFNKTEPLDQNGNPINSGWQYEGLFDGFIGTPIAPNYFITAQHIGGSIGDTITFGGLNYTTTAVFNSPNSDLRIWRISGAFNTYAPLYTKSDETGKGLYVYGRGTQRGGEVDHTVGTTQTPNGWLWGAGDSVERWGENTVTEIAVGDSSQGEFLRATFDHNAGPNEGHLSAGDSGGGVFIFDITLGQWALAGINYGVDGPYYTDAQGNGAFNAALFDQTGYFLNSGTPQAPIYTAATGPGSFYSTRISSNAGWISSIIPEPQTIALLVTGCVMLFLLGTLRGRNRRDSLQRDS